MPIYVYKCRTCGHVHEALQKVSDPPLTTCPVCQGALERQFSGHVGLQFNGSGFYITDYARKKSPGEEKSTQKAETKSETKTA
ncbi:MAG: hypothetical protein D6814_14485 [Calditrichaeota bacterium]|nr:MAG: hypothetical protein D6814_14485 [Calditrichota bacterium]